MIYRGKQVHKQEKLQSNWEPLFVNQAKMKCLAKGNLVNALRNVASVHKGRGFIPDNLKPIAAFAVFREMLGEDPYSQLTPHLD